MKYKLFPGGRAPERMSEGAVGFDVWARSVELIEVSEVSTRMDNRGMRKRIVGARISLGFAIDVSGYRLDPNVAWGALLLPRSGWGSNYGFRLKNTTGVIDPDYRGEVMMVAEFGRCPPELEAFSYSVCNGCENLSHDHQGCGIAEACAKDEPPRVGQMLIVPSYVGELQQVESLDETERGEGGFGSTG